MVSHFFLNNDNSLTMTVGSALPSMVSDRGNGGRPNSVVHLLTIQSCSSSHSKAGKHIRGVYYTLCFHTTSHIAQPLQSLGFLPTSPNLPINQLSVSAAVSSQSSVPTCLNLLVSRDTDAASPCFTMLTVMGSCGLLHGWHTPHTLDQPPDSLLVTTQVWRLTFSSACF